MTRTTTAVHQSAQLPRPPSRIRAKKWQGDEVARVVYEALRSRDVDDPKSLTDATVALLAGVERLLDRSLGSYETRRFRRLASTAKPSTIIRLVHQLNGRVRARPARALATRSDISNLIWG